MQLRGLHWGYKRLLITTRSMLAVGSPGPLRATRASRCPQTIEAAKLSSRLKQPILPAVTKLEWQQPLSIIRYPDPRLRAPNAPIAVFDDSLLALAREMIRIMYEDDGVGLAAPQVGVNVRLMVFNEFGKERPGSELILVNPEIVLAGKEKDLEEEGCLSFPKMYGEVERNLSITIKALNEKGEPLSLSLKEWPARIFQHEFDHLQGVLFHDRMKPAVLDVMRPKLAELEDAFAVDNPTVSFQRVPPPKVFKGFGAKP